MKASNIIDLANEAERTHRLPQESDNMRSGVIHELANEARFTASNYNEPLSAYIVGWRDPENLEVLLEELAPAVPVGRRFEFKKGLNAEAFLSETDDVRAIGDFFKRVDYKGVSVNEKTLNKGLTIRIDKDEQLGAGWQEQAAGRLKQRLLRNEVRRAFALINTAAHNTAKTWTTTQNPDGDLRASIALTRAATGISANKVFFAQDAWDARAACYESLNTPYAGRAGAMTKEQLANKLGVDLVEVVRAQYQSSASAKGQVQLALTILMLYGLSGVGKDDPSNVKRFVTDTDAGRFKVYLREYEKWTDITVEHYSNIVVVESSGIEKLTITAS